MYSFVFVSCLLRVSVCSVGKQRRHTFRSLYFGDRDRVTLIFFSFVKIQGFSDGASGKESTCQCRKCKRHVLDHWVRKVPGVRNSNPLQYSCLENSLDKEACQATVRGVAKNRTQLNTTPLYSKTLGDFQQRF